MRKLTRWLVVPSLFAVALGAGSLPAVASHNADAHSSNLALVANRPGIANPATPGVVFTNSDLAFWGNRVYAGNYNGFRTFDITNPRNPVQVTNFTCPGPQNDVSVWNNDADPAADLLFLSVDSVRTDNTCGSTALSASEVGNNQATGWEGIRIIDINNEASPTVLANVPLDCGSHTHTLVPGSGANAGKVYLYNSSYPTSGRTNDVDFADNGATYDGVTADRLVGQRNNGTDCLEPEPRPQYATGEWEANKSFDKISVVTVDLANPAAADNPAVRTESATAACDGAGTADTCLVYPSVTEVSLPSGTRHTQLGSSDGRMAEFIACHDIAAFMEINALVGSCWDETLIWDITNPALPEFQRRIRNESVDLLNHSVTFSWDGKSLLIEDEAGGGSDDRCNDPNDLQGRMWRYDLSGRLEGSFKIPRAQGETQNCTAHLYNFIPMTNGRELVVSAWYQGGTSVIDWTNPARPKEIGFYDAAASTGPGPSNVWASYWYNGYVYVNDIFRGLEVYALNDPRVDAAVTLPFFNPQTQMNLIKQNRTTCRGQTVTDLGTNLADTIVGTTGRDVIAGLGGNDKITSMAGNDVICGGGGNDRISGGGGSDKLLGEAGNDRLSGGAGRDLCVGGPGNDRGTKCEKLS